MYHAAFFNSVLFVEMLCKCLDVWIKIGLQLQMNPMFWGQFCLRHTWIWSENCTPTLQWPSCSWRCFSKLQQMSWAELQTRRISANEPYWFSSALPKASMRRDLLTRDLLGKTWTYFQHNKMTLRQKEVNASMQSCFSQSMNSAFGKWCESLMYTISFWKGFSVMGSHSTSLMWCIVYVNFSQRLAPVYLNDEWWRWRLWISGEFQWQ